MSFRPTMMTVRALAERWQMDPSSIYRMVKQGEIPRLRIGKMIRIPIAAIERLELEAAEIAADEPEPGPLPEPAIEKPPELPPPAKRDPIEILKQMQRERRIEKLVAEFRQREK